MFERITECGIFRNVFVESPPAAPAETRSEPGPRRYHVGTLSYTKAGLFNVFFWMLWGDLCLNVMESAIPRMVPLQLQSLGASNAVIGLLTGSMMSLINWITNPLISTWSDRHRGKLGRRIPFLLYPTPLLALFLVGVGFSLNIAEYLRSAHPGVGHAVARTASALLPDVHTLTGTAQVGIGVLAVMLLLFKLCDQFPQCVYYYLFTDVIPSEVMGSFVCYTRVFATAGGFIFHYWLLGLSESHPHEVYIGCALLYLIAFITMSLAVKEGTYPPAKPREKRPVVAFGRWAKDCFSSAFYWKYFLAYACFRWAFVPFNTFLIVYAQKGVGMSSEQFGHAFAIVLAVQLPVLLLLGPVIDRFHPIRVGLFGYIALAVAGVAGYLLIHGQTSFLILTNVAFIAITVFQSAISTLGPRVLPREKYGQFCSATMIVVETGMLVLAWACGAMLDQWGVSFLFLWLTGFAGLGLAANLVFFRAWRQHGGDDRYVAPGDFDTALLEHQGHTPAAGN